MLPEEQSKKITIKLNNQVINRILEYNKRKGLFYTKRTGEIDYTKNIVNYILHSLATLETLEKVERKGPENRATPLKN